MMKHGGLVTKSCPTLCDPMDCSTPGFPVPHYLLEFDQVRVHWIRDAIQPSHPLLPSSPFALNLSQHQGLFQRISCPLQICKWMNEWMDGMVRCWSNLPYDVTCDIAQEVWREKILKAKRRSPRFLSFLKHFLTFSTYNTGSLELPRIIQIQAKNQSIQKIKTETLL